MHVASSTRISSNECSQVRHRLQITIPAFNLEDMSLSKDLTDQFKERMQQNHHDADLNFGIMVLGTNFWPLNPPSHDFVIPAQILPTYNRFQKYYQSKHSGRKLTWLWNYSKNELRTNYLNQKYILMTSSYQMVVLLQYNINDTLSLSELITATSIPKELILQVLALLVKAKILLNEELEQYDLNPSSSRSHSTLTCLDSFVLGFKSKKIRVNLNQPIKAEVSADVKDVLKHVDEDRKYVIQATIVRYVFIPTHVYRPHVPMQYHESTKNNEESSSGSGSDFTDFAALCAQDS